MMETDLKKGRHIHATELESLLNNKEYWNARGAGYWHFKVSDDCLRIEITEKMPDQIIDVDEDDVELCNRICDVLDETGVYEHQLSEYAQMLMQRHDLTQEDVDDAFQTINDIDLDKLLMQLFPLFYKKPWALKLFHYKLKLRMEEADDFDYFD